jgi:hypothetical protein
MGRMRGIAETPPGLRYIPEPLDEPEATEVVDHLAGLDWRGTGGERRVYEQPLAPRSGSRPVGAARTT